MQAMAQRQQQWRSGSGEKAWLALLVETFETAARADTRQMPCDPATIAELKAQLARPAGSAAPTGSWRLH